MEQKLSHYRRHKFETNPYKARQHDAMYTVMVLLDFFCNFTLTLLIFFFNFRYVLLRSVIVKILPPDPVAAVNKLTIKYSTSSVGRSQWKIDTKASDVGEGNLAKQSQANQHILYQCSGHSDPALTRSHRHTAKTASTN